MVQLSNRAKIGIAVTIIVVAGMGSLGWMILSSSSISSPPLDEDLPMGMVTILKSGFLERIDSNHLGSGEFQLVQGLGGNQSIYFHDVLITTGPDLYVYLSKKSTFTGLFDSPGEYTDLGLLPSVQGNFSVGVPSSINGSDYESVVIWCKAFAVLFTYAPLS